MNTNPPSTLRALLDLPRPITNGLAFFKPSPDDGTLEFPCEADGLTTNRIVRVARFTIGERRCIPFHRHRAKEKVYVLHLNPYGPHPVVLLEDDAGAFVQYELKADTPFVVQANRWHAVVTRECADSRAVTRTAKVLVVASSQDGADVEWAPQGDWLVQHQVLADGGNDMAQELLTMGYQELDAAFDAR